MRKKNVLLRAINRFSQSSVIPFVLFCFSFQFKACDTMSSQRSYSVLLISKLGSNSVQAEKITILCW